MSKEKMPEKRIIEIRSIVKTQKAVTVSELSDMLGVSSITIRKDLEKLHKEGLIKKVFGGAVLKERINLQEPVFDEIKQAMHEEKERIAFEASKRVEDGNSVILQSGATTFEIIKYISEKKDLTITTDGVPALNELWNLSKSKKDMKIFCCGGLLKSNIGSFVGRNSLDFLKTINADIAFIGATSVSIEKGISSHSTEDSDIIKEIVNSSNNTILVCDSTKFGKKSLINTLPIDKLDEIITNKNLGGSLVNMIRSLGIKITLV